MLSHTSLPKETQSGNFIWTSQVGLAHIGSGRLDLDNSTFCFGVGFNEANFFKIKTEIKYNNYGTKR